MILYSGTEMPGCLPHIKGAASTGHEIYNPLCVTICVKILMVKNISPLGSKNVVPTAIHGQKAHLPQLVMPRWGILKLELTE